LPDLAASAARVSSWGNDKPSVQFNQLVISQEQLEAYTRGVPPPPIVSSKA